MARVGVWLAYVLVAVGVAGLLWGWVEARLFVIRRATVPVLPVGSEPIRVLHISDIHLSPRQRMKARWVSRLARERPDLVIDTGDNIAHASAVPSLVKSLGPLLRVPGAFVNGSNDYLGPRPQNPFIYFRGPTGDGERRAELPTSTMVSAFERAGWCNLGNARTTLTVRGTTVSFVGVDDPHLGLDVVPPDNRKRGDVHVGVAHAPYARVLEAFRAEGAAIVFAGHTHGGQVRIPWFGAVVTNCDLDRGRARGLGGWPGARPGTSAGASSIWLHVSAGIGTSPFAVLRFACRPEATVVTLVARSHR